MHDFRFILLGCLGIGVLIAAYTSPFTSPANSNAHVIAAIRYHNDAAAIVNKPASGGVTGIVSQGDWDAIYRYDKKALSEAEQADIADMNRHCPGFGDHFQNEFIKGLKLIVDYGNDPKNGVAFMRGQVLVAHFGDWYEANVNAIRNKK